MPLVTKPARRATSNTCWKCKGLTLIDEVQRAVGFQDVAAVAHGRQVSGRIQITATGFLHDHGQRGAFSGFEFFKEYALSAIALDQQPGFLQVGDDIGQVVVVGAFAHHVLRRQFDVQAFVHFLTVRQRDVLEAGPQLQAFRIARLQLDHQATRALGEVFGFVETAFGGAVEVFQVRQLVAGGRGFLQVGQQHAELSTPVADVVLTNDGVTEELENTGHAVANDGRTQVADVHLFGQVRRRQINHDALRRTVLAHRQCGVGQRGIEARGQGLGVLEEIEEARTCDIDLGDLLVGRQRSNDFLSQIARLHACGLGQHHGDIAGEIAVFLVLGVFHLNRRRQPFRQDAFGDELAQSLLNQLANGVFHGALFRPQARQRSMRGWKNWALSVAGATLPTAMDARL